MSKTATETRSAPKPAPKSAKRRPVRSECCEDTCSSGAKNRYFIGKRLTPAAFKLEQDYLVERRRLLNRAIHGWGVVYGYPITLVKQDRPRLDARGRLEIGAGLALDQPGRELFQADSISLSFSSVTVFDQDGHREPAARERGTKRRDPPPKVCWLLSVHYAERQMAPLDLKDPCSCERHEWDQVCETVHYTVRPIDCEKCCAPQPCELECGCGTGPCCDDRKAVPKPAPASPPPAEHPHEAKLETMPARTETDRIAETGRLADILNARALELAANPDRPGGAEPVAPRDLAHTEPVREDRLPVPERQFPRGGCRCLCDHLTALKPGADCTRLSEIETECGPLHVDLHNGVPLACVLLGQDECGDWTFASVLETCGPRRLVKRNDLLFDLIRGCDLTRIKATGFGKWHRDDKSVPFPDFESAFGDQEKDGEVLTRDFWIEFSRPVRVSTLRPSAFVMTVIYSEEEGGWHAELRVPIVRVQAEGAQPGDPAGHARRARMVVDGTWHGDALRGRRTIFDDQQTSVEFRARGDGLIDCNGQRVDGNVPGRGDAETGNGTPGNDAVWTFAVAAKQPEHRSRGVKP